MFASNLKKLRLSYKLTQKELAENLGTSQQTYMKWESGKISPTLTTITKIAEFFDIPISNLVSNGIMGIEDILNAEILELNNIQLTQDEADEFKYLIDLYIKNNLNYYSNMKSTKHIILKSGKVVSNANN